MQPSHLGLKPLLLVPNSISFRGKTLRPTAAANVGITSPYTPASSSDCSDSAHGDDLVFSFTFLCFRVRPFCLADELVIVSHDVLAVDVRTLLDPINAVCDWGRLLPTETAKMQANNSGLCTPIECFEASALLLDGIPVQLPRAGGGGGGGEPEYWPEAFRWHHVMRHASCRPSLVSRTRQAVTLSLPASPPPLSPKLSFNLPSPDRLVRENHQFGLHDRPHLHAVSAPRSWPAIQVMSRAGKPAPEVQRILFVKNLRYGRPSRPTNCAVARPPRPSASSESISC